MFSDVLIKILFFNFELNILSFFFPQKRLRQPNFTLHFIYPFHTGSLSEKQNENKHDVTKYFSFSHKSQFENFSSVYEQKQMANHIFTMTALGFIGHNYLLIPVTVKFYWLFLLVCICGVKRLLN